MYCWYFRKFQGNYWKLRRKCYLLKDNVIFNSIEEIIGVWVYWDDMSVIRVFFQGFVDLVDKSIFFFFCK